MHRFYARLVISNRPAHGFGSATSNQIAGLNPLNAMVCVCSTIAIILSFHRRNRQDVTEYSRGHVKHKNGIWRSLVARLTGGQEVVGSNPAIPIIFTLFCR